MNRRLKYEISRSIKVDNSNKILKISNEILKTFKILANRI